MATLDEILAKWEARRLDGAQLGALAPLATIAADVLKDLRELELGASDVLSVKEAALLSGYSEDHLRREIARGQIANAGKKGKPAIRRADVPRKPGHPAPLPRPAASARIDARRQIVLGAMHTPPRSA